MTDGNEQKVQVPLTDFVKQIAREAAFTAGKEIIETHVKTCPHGQKLGRYRAKVAGMVIVVVLALQAIAWSLAYFLK